MVFANKFLTPQQMKEGNTTKTWKARSRMVICGKFAIDNERLCESTSTHHVDIGLLRMVLSLTNGRAETITTTDNSTAFLNAPMDEALSLIHI
eukprot:735645-Prorocentrum_lima.AAC.1